MKKPSISKTLESEEVKQALIDYATSRGIGRLSDLVWVSVVAYIRQRPPKKGCKTFKTLERYLQ